MRNSHVIKRIDSAPIDLEMAAFSKDCGAVLQFLGVVRELEEGRILTGIKYSCYEPMAWSVLDETIASAEREFGSHDLYFHHRLGYVPVAEPSVIVRVATGHSAAAFDLCQSYLNAVKRTLPIWKEPVFEESCQEVAS